MADRSHLSIGEVLSLLREEFPDVTISKIRFLESQGLVDPERTPSGYRKFYEHDVERLRWILRQQREHFLPLKVIRGRLSERSGEGVEAGEAGDEEPAAVAAGQTWAASSGAPISGAQVSGVPVSGIAAGRPASGSDGSARPMVVPGRGAPVPPAPAPPASGPPAPVPPAPVPQTSGPASGPPASGPASGPPVAAAAAAPAPEAPSGPAPAGGSRAAVTPALFAGLHSQSEAPAPAGPAPATHPVPAPPAPAVTPAGLSAEQDSDTFTAEELAVAAGTDVGLISDLKQYGLIAPHAVVAGTPYYDVGAVAVARAAADFARHGVEARHLRIWKNAADREADLFQQVVLPLLRQRNPQARRQAAETLADIARAGAELRAALVERALREIR